MRLVSWNVNGIRAVVKKGFMDALLRIDADVLCLQETRATGDQLPPEITNLERYRTHWVSGEKKGYSGVGMLLRPEPMSISAGMAIERFDREGRVLVAEYPAFSLMSVYFPNGGMSDERLQYKLDFYDAFLGIVDQLHAEGRSIIVCGDVNTAHREIDIYDPQAHANRSGFLLQERAWIDTLLEHGMVDSFRHLHPDSVVYSWWDQRIRARSRNDGWRLDYFFISKALLPRLTDAFILTEVMGSDHCPVGIDLDFS